MLKKRDFQRSKVYASEWELRHLSVRYKTDKECLTYVNRILRSAWWKKHYPRAAAAYVKIVFHNGNRSWAYPNKISFGRKTMDQFSVLHELAHIVNDGDRHGERFAKTYLEMVKHYLGKEVWKLLKQAFKDHKVKFVIRKSNKRVPALVTRKAICPICGKVLIYVIGTKPICISCSEDD